MCCYVLPVQTHQIGKVPPMEGACVCAALARTSGRTWTHSRKWENGLNMHNIERGVPALAVPLLLPRELAEHRAPDAGSMVRVYGLDPRRAQTNFAVCLNALRQRHAAPCSTPCFTMINSALCSTTCAKALPNRVFSKVRTMQMDGLGQ